MTIPDVLASENTVFWKVVQLWAIAMINYRQPEGDEAFKQMRKLIGEDAVSAISFLTGFCFAGFPNKERLEELLKEQK